MISIVDSEPEPLPFTLPIGGNPREDNPLAVKVEIKLT